MSNTREILTFQFGHYSNFVGTHFWNLQESTFNYTTPETEINHDILYREGQTSKGHGTYTPRLLLVDLKGSLKHLPQDGNLYNDTTSDVNDIKTWSTSQVEVKKDKKLEKNTYQQMLDANTECLDTLNLESEVDVWADFLYTRFHPRTINIINEYKHKNNDVPFETFPCGSNVWQSDYFSEEFTDKIRLYSEECDNMQGFQILSDATDAFGGLATSCIDNIRDDYENKSILTVPLIPSFYNDLNCIDTRERNKSVRKNLMRQINFALTLSKMYEYSSLIVPMSLNEKGWRDISLQNLKYLNYNNEYNYHTSAILASALDTFSLRYRNKTSHLPSYLFHTCNDLNGMGRKIVAASLGIPFGIQENQDLIDCLNDWKGPLWQSLTPRCKIGTDRCMQTVTLRGISEQCLKRPATVNTPQREMPAYKCNTVNEMLSFYLSCVTYATASHVTTLSKPLNVKIPFPNFFTSNVNVNGLISAHKRPENQRVNSVSVISGLHSSSGIGDMLEVLHRETSRLKMANFNEFITAGLEVDDYKDSLEEILNIRERYIDEHFL